MYFGAPESYAWYAKRCVLYVRVSTEEQVRSGYSLGAQLEALQDFAKRFCMDVVGVCADDGVSARKEVHKRKGLQEALEIVENNGTDYVLFIKLDRWFRSVQEYYRVQDMLDKHSVHWKAILEDYDTSTTNGRLNLNIRLSIAQDESDRTGDRIRFVQASLVKNGRAISGSHNMPFGLFVKDGRVLVDEEKSKAVQSMFDYFEETASRRGCIDHIKNNFGVLFYFNTIRRMLSNTLYKGEYKGVAEYCQPTISTEQFERVQRLLEATKKTRENRFEYTLTGLMICPLCGNQMAGWANHDYKYGRVYKRFRCNRAYISKRCEYKQTVWEERVERYLLDTVRKSLEGRIIEYETRKKESAKNLAPDRIKRQLVRLKELYLGDLIDMQTYREDYERLRGELEKMGEVEAERPPDAEEIKRFLSYDFETLYNQMDIAGRRALWASIIKSIAPITFKEYRVEFL